MDKESETNAITRLSTYCTTVSLGAVWIAYSDEETEGTFVNVNTGDRLGAEKDPYQNWDRLSTEPNGGTIENCASLRYGKNIGEKKSDDKLLFYACM